MIDHYLQTPMRLALGLPAKLAHKLNISANQITLAGFGFGLVVVGLIAFGFMGAALIFIVLNRFCDGLDGAVARLAQQQPYQQDGVLNSKGGALKSERGAYLDIALDFVFYALVPLGFALYDPATNALAACFLLTGFVGTGSSFLAYAAIAAKRGQTKRQFTHKAIHYLGGLTEGFETILFFFIICLRPDWFLYGAYIFGAACYVTTICRWYQAWRDFE